MLNVSETIVDVHEKPKNNKLFALTFSPWCVVPSPTASPTAVASFRGLMDDWLVALDNAMVLFMTLDCLSKLVAENSARKYEFLSNISTRIIRTTQNGNNTGTGNGLVCAGNEVAITCLKVTCLFCWTQTPIRCSRTWCKTQTLSVQRTEAIFKKWEF